MQDYSMRGIASAEHSSHSHQRMLRRIASENTREEYRGCVTADILQTAQFVLLPPPANTHRAMLRRYAVLKCFV